MWGVDVTVTFRFPHERAIDLVGFGWSPLFEAVLSMAVVARPKRTPMHLPWTRRCRDLLPADLLDDVRDLAHAFDGRIPGIFEVGLVGDSTAFADELAAFRGLEDDVVAYELSITLGGFGCAPAGARGPQLVHDATYRDEVVAFASARYEQHAAMARAVFDDPAGERDRIARLLERYWDAAFEQEWARVLPRIEAEVTDGARALVTRGVPGVVDELLPEGLWDETVPSIVVDRTYDAACDVAERGGLLLVPTVYGWPRVLIELDERWPLAIFVPLRDLRQPEVPQEADHAVADGLRALGDETRLQITRMIAEQPRSTKELSELLKLSDSSISRHLKLLDGAGVVTKQRDGYFVLYRLRPERIGQLGAALRHTLGLDVGSGQPVPALPVSVSRGIDG
jgi:DNA-binding transcriptional ArsR family regulator